MFIFGKFCVHTKSMILFLGKILFKIEVAGHEIMQISRRIHRNAVSFFDGKLHACPTSMIFLDELFVSLYDNLSCTVFRKH